MYNERQVNLEKLMAAESSDERKVIAYLTFVNNELAQENMKLMNTVMELSNAKSS